MVAQRKPARHRAPTIRFEGEGLVWRNGKSIIDGIAYPGSDGQPMGQTEVHILEIMRTYQTLDDAYADAPYTYVAADMLLYYERGAPSAVVVPDVFVVHGVPKRPARTSYFLWLEGRVPDVAFEVTSDSTRLRDQREKRALYARLGIAEYVLYDPSPKADREPLQVLRLVRDRYVTVAPGADGRYRSERLGMSLGLVDGRLRFYHGRTGEMLRSPAERTAEAVAQARTAEEHARAAEEHARAAEEQVRVTEEHVRVVEARATSLEAENAALRERLMQLDQP